MYSQIAANKRKTVVLLIGFILFITLLGWLFSEFMGRPSITVAVLAGCLLYALISYYSAAKLATALNGAEKIEKRDNPRLYRIVENLAITDGLPTPDVYIIDDPAPNAFATGRDPQHSLVAVTAGLLEIMDDKELEGVLAHELGHIKNYDIRVSMMAFALVAVVGILSDVILRMAWFGGRDDDNNSSASFFYIIAIVAAILAPIIATIIQLAVSRKREFLADATGALTTRYPEGLASALEKIETTGSTLKKQNTSTAHFFFANPLKNKSFMNLFSTHPPIEERIKALHEMETKV